MAGRDRSGPEGMGPLTGRGLGYCSGKYRPGDEAVTAFTRRRRAFGRGFGRNSGQGDGRGQGSGRGYGNFTRGPVFEPSDGTPQTLPSEIAGLRDRLRALEDRLANLVSRDR
jgi:hypothetical protein